MVAMNRCELRIIQGTEHPYPPADINIVIDVIRAFTVSHIAFLSGAHEIFLVNTVEEAFALKVDNPSWLLAGEIAGLPIINFDLDNSPFTFSHADISNKTLVQKTTNGVKATLLALDAATTLVTGFTNAKKSALYIKKLVSSRESCVINIIASHAGDDDDLACAEYIQDILLGSNKIHIEAIQSRIKGARSAQKFFDPARIEFDARDIDICTREIACDFVMLVDKSLTVPKIVKKQAF